MSDWPDADAKACYDFAIHCLQAEQLGAAVRDPGPDRPLELIVRNAANLGGQWGLIQLEPRHALHMAEKLIEGARLRLK